MKIEYDLYENLTFFILSHVLFFFANYDCYDYILMKSNQRFFFLQVPTPL